MYLRRIRFLLLLGMLPFSVFAQLETELFAQYFYTGDSIILSTRVNFIPEGDINLEIYNQDLETILDWDVPMEDLLDGASAQKLRMDTNFHLPYATEKATIVFTNKDKKDSLEITFEELGLLYLDEQNKTNYSQIFLIQPSKRYKLLFSSRTKSVPELLIKHVKHPISLDVSTSNWPVPVILDTLLNGMYQVLDKDTNIVSSFQIINPRNKYNPNNKLPKLGYDLDTTRNDFAELSPAKLAKAVKLSSFRMNAKAQEQLKMLMADKQYQIVSTQLLHFWAYQNPDIFWKINWEDYVSTANALYDKYKGRAGGMQAPELGLQLRYGTPDEQLESSNHPDVWPYKLWVFHPKKATDKLKYYLMTRGNMENKYRIVLNSELSDKESWKKVIFKNLDNALNESSEVYQKTMELIQEEN